MTATLTADGQVQSTRPGPGGEATLGGSSVAALVRSGGPEIRIAHVAIVTAGLVAVGAAVGSTMGVLVAAMMMHSEGETLEFLLDPGWLLFIGAFGAVMGAVLGPLAAWLLMRHVPLWKAVGGTALGTLAGSLLGALGDGGMAFCGAFLGFGAAAFLLWLEDAWKTRNDAPAGPGLPRV